MSSVQIAVVFAVLMDAALRGTLVLLAAWGATRLMRRRSAAARHLVWVVALGSLLALPLLSRVLPAWRTVPVPAPLRPAASFVAAPQVLAPLLETPRLAADAPASPSPSAQGALHPPSTLDPRTPAASFDWKNALLGVWTLGGALLLARLLFGLARVWWLQRRAEEVTDEGWVRITDGLARRLRVGRMVTLLREAHAQVPMTWGIVNPVVLLPAGADEWSTERRTVVLAHELAHVRRWDTLTQWVAHLALALFWFNPLVWVAARKLREEREHACDDAVLSIGTRPVAYADHLLQIVRSLGEAEGPAAALAMARRSQFEGRLLAILDNATARGGVSRGLGVAALALATMAVLPLAAVRAAEPPPASAAASTAAASDAAPPSSARPGVLKRLAGQVNGLLEGAAAHPRTPASALRPQTALSAGDSSAGGVVIPRAPRPPASPAAPAAPSAPAAGAPLQEVDALARQLGVTPGRAAEMLQPGGGYADVIRAADGIASSGDHAAVLLAVLRRPDVGPGDVVLLLRSSTGISSNGDRAEVLRAVAERRLLGPPAARSVFFESVLGISSDGDRRDVLRTVLLCPATNPETVSQVVNTARAIASNADRRNVLTLAVSRPVAGPPQLVQILEAAAELSSGAEQREVLLAVLERPSLTGSVLGTLFRVAALMGGSAERRDVLLAAARTQRLQGAAREAYLSAASGIASSADRAIAVNALLDPPGAPSAVSTVRAAGSAVQQAGVWDSEITLSGLKARDASGGEVARSIRVVARGVVLGSAPGEVRSIRSGGRLMVEERRGAEVRWLEMLPERGGLRTRFTLNGASREFDADGHRWLGALIHEFTGK